MIFSLLKKPRRPTPLQDSFDGWIWLHPEMPIYFPDEFVEQAIKETTGSSIEVISFMPGTRLKSYVGSKEHIKTLIKLEDYILKNSENIYRNYYSVMNMKEDAVSIYRSFFEIQSIFYNSSFYNINKPKIGSLFVSNTRNENFIPFYEMDSACIFDEEIYSIRGNPSNFTIGMNDRKSINFTKGHYKLVGEE